MADSSKPKSVIEEMMMATNIDRRQCTRVVPLEVLCFGLSRTGTLSLREALKQLGYHDTYHYSSLALENPRDCEMWIDAFKAKFEGKGKQFQRHEWDQLLGHCMAVTDSPSVFFWEDLLAAYPDAKIILTVRETDAYYRSFMKTLQVWGEKWNIPSYNPLQRIYQLFIPKSAFQEMNDLLYRYGHGMDFPETGKERYLKHNEAVRQKVGSDRLLEFDVTKDGWEPLCKFLGKDVPDIPFPRANDYSSFMAYWAPVTEGTDKIVIQRMKNAALMTAASVTVGYFCWKKLWSR